MAAEIIDGKAIAAELTEKVKTEIANTGIKPHLVAVLVGEDAASIYYANSQKKSAEEVGIVYTLDKLPATTTQDQLIARIGELNQDKDVTGIIMLVPLPKGIDAGVVQQHIDYTKDVEGITPTSLGLLLQDRPHLVPCTALAAVEILQRALGHLEGLNVTVLGRSVTVGRPVAVLLLSKSAKRNCTVTVCHTATKDLTSKVKQADVLVAAAGVAEFVKGSWIKPGAVVIDVGINRIPVLDANGQPVLDAKGKKKMKTVGDVEFETAKEVASKITPVPGGVGSMTTAILMQNTLLAAKLLQSRR